MRDCEFQQLEHWLLMLINTYQDQPNKALAKVIYGHIKQLYPTVYLSHTSLECQQWQNMKKFWRWRSQC